MDLAEAIKTLTGVSTATLTSQLSKRGLNKVFMKGVRPLSANQPRFAGEAYTVRMIPAREDLGTYETLRSPDNPARKAIEHCPAGKVLVIDARGVTEAAVGGDILFARLQVRGVAGLVTDGGVRDAEEVRALGLPVQCAGPAAPASIGAHFAVGLDEPVACGGVAVMPGDVLVGDGDGVVVIPRKLVAEVARDGAEQERLERFLQQKVRGGASIVGVYPPNEATLAEYKTWKG